MHSNDPDSLEVNAKDALVEVVGFAGPEPMVVFGAVVSAGGGGGGVLPLRRTPRSVPSLALELPIEPAVSAQPAYGVLTVRRSSVVPAMLCRARRTRSSRRL